MPPQGWEALSVFHPKGAKRWSGGGNLLCLRHEDPCYPELLKLEHLCLRGEDKHKTEKPLDQALDLVSWFSEPGERVLDLCAGRGTTAVACALLGRDFLGAELDPAEAGRAQERISKAERGELSDRDQERFRRYRESVISEDVSKFTAPSQARYAKRLADVQHAERLLAA